MPYEPSVEINLDKATESTDLSQELNTHIDPQVKGDVAPTLTAKRTQLHLNEFNYNPLDIQTSTKCNDAEKSFFNNNENGKTGKHVEPSIPYWTKMASVLRRHSTNVKSHQMSRLTGNLHSHQLHEANDIDSLE